jgi:hypothetical protein
MSPSVFRFEKIVLAKYPVRYYKCGSCDFVQTSDAFWLAEAYSEALSPLDTGIVMRNLNFAEVTARLIDYLGIGEQRFLDFAGGSGLFTRLMRDKGYNYFREDKYCQNVFSRCFDKSDLPESSSFALLSAFEVFEHLSDPMEEIAGMLKISDLVFFSTELQPESDLENWWYLTPESGQHIGFYTHNTLTYIAKELGCQFRSDGKGLHAFFRGEINLTDAHLQALVKGPGMLEKIWTKVASQLHLPARRKKRSLVQDDFNYVLNKLKQ